MDPCAGLSLFPPGKRRVARTISPFTVAWIPAAGAVRSQMTLPDLTRWWMALPDRSPGVRGVLVGRSLSGSNPRCRGAGDLSRMIAFEGETGD